MVSSMEGIEVSTLDSDKKSDEDHRCSEKYPHPISASEAAHGDTSPKEQISNAWVSKTCEKPVEDANSLSCRRKLSVLYDLLTACLVGTTFDGENSSVKGYDSRHRVALRLLATWLDVKWTEMEAMEVIVACSLLGSTKGEVEKRNYADDVDKWKQGGIIGATAVAGGTAMAVTGGIAAPAIGQGLSTVATAVGASGIAAAAASAGSIGGSIAISASFGAAGAGLCGSKMAKRMGSIQDFEFKALGKNHKQGVGSIRVWSPIYSVRVQRLAVGIMVSGLVFEEDDFLRPWRGQNVNLESEGAMQTVLGSAVSAFSLPAALANASDVIDSKWAVPLDSQGILLTSILSGNPRSDKAGKLLAEVLLEGHHGNRPVTLIGFSLGARLIFKCLQHLAETGNNGGLVERVVLLGAPVSLKDENWTLARKVVPGRFVNAYSTIDWTLGVVFRSSLASTGLAGIQPADVPGIENVDVTHLVDGHASYISITEQILERLELESYSAVWKDL
ncbi:hypothetical protein Cgig2_026536 [Carnegiea gigantea]|uniref:Transmembrane and coiled-coil domain-containing protein 4 n=1 Tax=Carnegiea gigantea TaxID=171969 RepID=A0A9Q1KFK1_9CARY|nr:hypothetical protein Cgig2_026536 [Carnegiea gigantea]